jgi:ABC-2 type transport system ATP-binding protein
VSAAAPPAAAGIAVSGLAKSYRGSTRRALDGVDLQVRPGEAFGIIGPNAAGKTTLLGCLLGHLRPTAGTIAIDGLSPDALGVKARIGYLPERLLFDRWMTGRRFLQHHHRLAGLPRATEREDVERVFAEVDLPPDAGRRRLATYSRGMLQRVGLAQALLAKPRYLFLDEPASGVDPAGVLLFRTLLARARAAGTTILLNSHQLDQVERVCERVAFMKGGRIESIEVLRDGAAAGVGAEGAARPTQRVRARLYAPADGRSPVPLEQVARNAGATMIEAAGGTAVFDVAGDPGAARLARALLEGGYEIIELRPEAGRLERLFDTAPGTEARA